MSRVASYAQQNNPDALAQTASEYRVPRSTGCNAFPARSGRGNTDGGRHRGFRAQWAYAGYQPQFTQHPVGAARERDERGAFTPLQGVMSVPRFATCYVLSADIRGETDQELHAVRRHVCAVILAVCCVARVGLIAVHEVEAIL